MTLTVSVSDLRNNMSVYLARALSGSRLLIRDQKKGKTIAQITAVADFDKRGYEQALKRAVGVFSVEHHPQWRTKTAVSRWLQKSRLADERTF